MFVNFNKLTFMTCSCGANPQKKNDRGESAIDLAKKIGRQNIANKLTSHVGQNVIDKLTKPNSTINDDDSDV